MKFYGVTPTPIAIRNATEATIRNALSPTNATEILLSYTDINNTPQ